MKPFRASTMHPRLRPYLLPLAVSGVLAASIATFSVMAADKAASSAARPALTVNVTQQQRIAVPVRIAANGNLAAWQEASVGTQTNGLRLAEVRVNVGDVVKRGQVLATFAADTVLAEQAQIRASVAEAEAALAEAAANAQRARDLQSTGALSAQQINQYLTAERTAKARLQAQQASAKSQQLRLGQTQVVAPDAGVISARSATVGAVLPAGQELFRLIRQGRLEWRGEVPAADLARVKPGMAVEIAGASGAKLPGKVRMVAPTVDVQTRNGLVYVDLALSSEARAGMFARGEIDLGSSDALTLPQSAVNLRDGFTYVQRVGADSKVTELKVKAGRRLGDRIEILEGLPADAKVVASGGGFLSDGDLVRVVDAAPAKAPAPAAAASTPKR
jgi:RND family efflux transporter MFP subunit